MVNFFRKFSIKLTLLGLAAASDGLVAQELHENWFSPKSLSMGDAYTAVANDEAAIWTNPAGIARARRARARNFSEIQVPNLGVGANAKGRKLYGTMTSKSSEALAESISSDDINDTKPYWANLHLMPLWMLDFNRNVPAAFGVYSNSTSQIIVDKSTKEQARVNIISDAGGVTNLTWTNNNNRASAGFQVRYNVRYAYEDTVPVDELGSKSTMQDRIKADSNQSSGIGVDFGTMLTFADFWFPTLGIAVLNIPTGCRKDYLNPYSQKRETVCGTVYSGDIPNEDALSTVDPTDLRVGLAITPRISRAVSLRLALDAHHIYVPMGSQGLGLSGIAAQKLLHGGAELFFANPLGQSPLSLKLGVNQGFLTSGFSIKYLFFMLDFATYGADISAENKSEEDRRYVANFSFFF